ncbi:MAG: hypothetical protein A2Z47_09310 [Thermodesulfovibrio sp. RBG_19FT_COMBO_42_12]|nr:MAG: hypothetical protein A2Z47_09310 [Thermodesulfovibrio sp. RBG_19FT_COMBO_42_12]
MPHHIIIFGLILPDLVEILTKKMTHRGISHSVAISLVALVFLIIFYWRSQFATANKPAVGGQAGFMRLSHIRVDLQGLALKGRIGRSDKYLKIPKKTLQIKLLTVLSFFICFYMFLYFSIYLLHVFFTVRFKIKKCA